MKSIQTIIVPFNKSGNDHIFEVQIDDILNVDLNGNSKSSFYPGDVAYLAVNRSNNTSITSVKCTSGVIGYLDTGERESTDDFLFDGIDNIEFISSLSSHSGEYINMGNAGNYINRINNLGAISVLSSGGYPFMLRIIQKYSIEIYRLSIPEDILIEDFKIGIVFEYEVV